MTHYINEQQAAELLRQADDILLLAHHYPDGDTLGSNFALCQALQGMGKRARVLCGDPIPARYDCVTVGSAATLRVDHIKAMLVLGLNEGEFPCALREDGLLSEQDKEILSELGISLDSRAERLNSDELLYVWRAFSKPAETLILSCSAASAVPKIFSLSSRTISVTPRFFSISLA